MPPPDWDPHAPEVLHDQRAAYDVMRDRCPVAHGADGGWTVFRHADVVRVLHDHETFSSAVSRHAAVPNGMDPPEHTRWRRLIEPYFSRERVGDFEPACRKLAAHLVDQAVAREHVELMTALALPFAARVQCAYLGWPSSLADTLMQWTQRNHEATLAGDRTGMAAIARQFDALVADLLHTRSAHAGSPPRDLTDTLIRETIQGRPIRPHEVSSILRNWTMGELGTIAAAIGILTHALAGDFDGQYQIRRHLALLPDAIDEILRRHGPLVSNRRVTTRQVELGGRNIAAGARVTINWMAANRDPEVFPSPDAFRLDRDAADNLLYGAGIHVCPGASLARMELRVIMEELLAATYAIDLMSDRQATSAAPPSSGFDTIPLRLVKA